MLALNLICLLLNILLCRNLTQMVARSNRALGSTRPIHSVALAFNIVAILILSTVVISAFFPNVVHLYQKLQVSYFAVQIVVQMPLLQYAIMS